MLILICHGRRALHDNSYHCGGELAGLAGLRGRAEDYGRKRSKRSKSPARWQSLTIRKSWLWLLSPFIVTVILIFHHWRAPPDGSWLRFLDYDSGGELAGLAGLAELPIGWITNKLNYQLAELPQLLLLQLAELPPLLLLNYHQLN